MERSTEPKATSDGARLNRVQMARALREGAGAEDGRGAEERTASVERNWSMDSGLRRVGARVTLGVLLASTLTGGRITALRADFLQRATAGGGGGGSIPGSPGPSVGSDGQSHSPIHDTNQEQQKKMFSKLTGVTAAIAVGASVTVAGAQNAAVQWKVSEGGNGHWYMLDLSRRPWTGAADRASALGGHLITVNSYAEHVFLRSSVFTYCCSMSDTWMGATRSSTDEEYHWVTGEQFVPLPEIYFNNNSAGWDAPALYLEQVIRFSWVGEWGGESNSANEGNFSVVEWSADCNNDGIVDYGQCLNGTLPDYNGNNIPDCCDRGEACVVGNYPVQWKVSDGGNGHWYGTLPGTGGNWYARAIEAEQKGGYLVTVSDAAEFAFVQRVSPWIYYLGGYRIDPVPPNDPTDGWRWVTGEPFPYSLRCTGWYPDSERWITAAAWQDCLGESDNSGPPYYYMVEWSADCNNDGTVDYGQILTGQLSDSNSNGVPDTCEFVDCNHDGIADSEQVARGQLPDYDGNNIPDCCDHGEACVMGSYPVQWRTASGGNGHWYQSLYVGPDPTHSEAVAVASSRGAYLATMNAQEEQAFCVKILQHSRAAEVVGGAWFGLVQDRFSPVYSEPSGGWVWGDGPVLFTNWASGEPSNDCFGAAEDFANIRPDGRWNDLNERPNCVGTLPGGVVNSVLIEWSADCNNDGTVDYGQILRGDLPDINHNGTPDTCECIGDIYVDRAINGADLGALLAYWGPTTSAAASRACDLNGDGVVSGSDLGVLLAYWGPCSN